MEFYWLKVGLGHPRTAFSVIWTQFRIKLLWKYYYNKLRDPKVEESAVPRNPKITKEIVDELENEGFQVVPYRINVTAYKNYLKKADYKRFPNYYGGGSASKFPEKSLEHYLAAEFLGLRESDIYLDIANASHLGCVRSPTPEIYSELYGCKVYRQDLIYPEGSNEKNRTIGGDAADMPVKDNFATAMALHCSFEHFEGDSDIRFIKEANRVLRDNGRICIVPLYLSKGYVIQTNPVRAVREKVQFDPDATLYCTKDFAKRFSRIYDVQHLDKRIRRNLGNFNMKIFVIENEEEIHPSCYVKFVALFQKKS